MFCKSIFQHVYWKFTFSARSISEKYDVQQHNYGRVATCFFWEVTTKTLVYGNVVTQQHNHGRVAAQQHVYDKIATYLKEKVILRNISLRDLLSERSRFLS